MTEGLTPELANAIAVKAMMCARTYMGDASESRFPIERLGWTKVDCEGRLVTGNHNSYTPKCWLGNLFSNLQFDVWEKQNGSESVIAFKGTDEKVDWLSGNAALGISVPYKSAKKRVRLYRKRFPGRTITLTGHSLGGGIALSVSVWLGIDAVVFNSSPRIFDGWRNMNLSATRLAVYQKGDPLQVIRERWPKFSEKVAEHHIYNTQFDFGEESNHRMDLLAEGILRLTTLPELVVVAKSLPRSAHFSHQP